jgi:hypothetical protein
MSKSVRVKQWTRAVGYQAYMLLIEPISVPEDRVLLALPILEAILRFVFKKRSIILSNKQIKSMWVHLSAIQFLSSQNYTYFSIT